MDTNTLIATIAAAVIGLIGTIIAALLGSGKVKLSTVKNTLTSVINVLSKLPTLIKRAEKVGTTGEERKAYVIEQAELMSAADGVALTEADKELIAEAIDNQVNLTKEINNTSKTTVSPIVNNTTIKRG